jgi:hypothetical protein
MKHSAAILTLSAWVSLISASVGAAETDNSSPVAKTAPTVTVRSNELREFDWAKLQAHARIAFVSSGPRTFAGRMIDNDLRTTFRFSAADSSPIVIVELAQTAELHRVTAVFSAENARVDIYLLNQLPKSPRDLQFATPTATFVDPPQDRGFATANFAVNSARFVALRWTRNEPRNPFEVAEISAFSNEPADFGFDQAVHLASKASSNLLTTEPPPVGVVSP